jgi:hypothetical protein
MTRPSKGAWSQSGGSRDLPERAKDPSPRAACGAPFPFSLSPGRGGGEFLGEFLGEFMEDFRGPENWCSLNCQTLTATPAEPGEVPDASPSRIFVSAEAIPSPFQSATKHQANKSFVKPAWWTTSIRSVKRTR